MKYSILSYRNSKLHQQYTLVTLWAKRTMRQQKTRFPLGTHLIVKHWGYSHHGIYAGRGRVIHYSGFAHLFKKRPIEITSLEKFSFGKPLLFKAMLSQNLSVVKWFAVCVHACMKTAII